MNRVITLIAAAALAILGLFLWLQGSSEAVTALIALIGLLTMSFVGKRMATPADMRWLPTAITVGYMAKLAASIARFSVLEFIYDGSGDATRYHRAGNELVQLWRSFEVPPLDVGTRALEAITAFLYVPYVPTKLGGFLLFATISFFGQLLLYAAFRISARPGSLRLYAAALLFLPTIVYWPSSIGKESLMFLFIGLAAYGAAAVLQHYRLRWALVFGIGTAGSAAIRPHVSLLLIAALSFALILGKGAAGRWMLGRKALLIVVIGAAAFVVIVATTLKFGIDFAGGFEATDDIQNVFDSVQDNTAQGGSTVAGSVVRSPIDFPGGALKVLFRPFPQEANNAQALASSIEGVFLLLMLTWRFLPILRNGRRIRKEPYLLFVFAFTISFVIAFSAFNNFGLLARQRSQVMPFVVALIVAFGWKWATDDGHEVTDSVEERPRKRPAGSRLA